MPVTQSLTEKLRGEVLVSPWQDLIPHFARGGLLIAASDLDLLDAAEALARDQQERVSAWLALGSLRRAHDEDARHFTQTPDLRFQLIVVQPWVLAQLLPSPNPS